MVSNRKDIEQMIYDTFDALDPSGENTNKYKLLFSSMNEKQFEDFMKEFLDNEDENFSLDIVDYENDIKMTNCEKAAKVLGVPLYEHVFLPHLSRDKANTVVSKEKCLVGYINIKRTQQFLYKKNGISIANDKRSALTGQVTDKDKNARETDIETSLLVSLGADKILEELQGPRADDMVMKRQMLQSIATKGYVMLDELESSPTNKVTLNTVNTYLLGMGIKSDLVSDSYILPKTSEEIFG